MRKEVLYSHLPVALQSLACTYYGYREKKIRMGSDFRRYYEFLLSTEWSDEQEIERYQNDQVETLIAHAFKTVPYYRNILQENGIKPSDITTREALSKLPVLCKEDVVLRSKHLLSTAPSKSRLRQVKTSGTTGTALKFYTTEKAIGFTWAVWWRHRHRFGFKPGDWHVNFTGKPVVPVQQNRPPYWRIDFSRKQIIVNAAHLVPQKTIHLVNYLNKSPVEYFTGYPSQIAQFCSLVESEGLLFKGKPRVVFPGAENVQGFQKDVIRRVTSALITDQYGFSEGCANASRCEHGHYHEDWEYGVLDCGDGVKRPDGSVTGKVIATGFANSAFPFIRYDVGDTAIWAPEHYRCPCGRQSRVIWSIDGRNEDYVITPEGNRIMRFDYLFKESAGIKEAQVVQRELGGIVVRIVPRPGFGDNDLELIRKLAREWISPALRIKFEKVANIERSQSGKFKPVISELNGNKH